MSHAVALQNHSTRRDSYFSVAARGPMLDRVYSLRYRSYSEEGYINKCSSRKFMDEFDARENCTSYLTYHDNELVGSIRACVYMPGNDGVVPVSEVFEDEIRDNVNLDAPVVEANKFVVSPSFQKKGGLRGRFSVFKNIVDHVLDINAKTILIAVRPEHVDFYKILYFSRMSEEKSYPHLSFKTILLKCDDIEALRARIWGKLGLNISEVAEQNDAVLNYRAN